MKYFFLLLSEILITISVFYGMQVLLSYSFQVLKITKTKKQKARLEDILKDKYLSFALFAGIAGIISSIISLWMLPLCLLIALGFSRKAYGWLIKHRQTQMRLLCESQLDIMSDIIAMGIKAGLSFDAALKLFVTKFDSSLAQQMAKCLSYWENGALTRSESLNKFSKHLKSNDFDRFVKTSLHAITQGAPLAEMLLRFSKDIREKHCLEIEKKVEKAPIKMFIPMGACILPAMLILVGGPVLLQFLGSSI